MRYEEFTEFLRNFWTPLLTLLTLLGVLLIILGTGLAGLVSALKHREEKRIELKRFRRLSP
jgi:hypothetical protein